MKRLTREGETRCDTCVASNNNGGCFFNSFPCPEYMRNERLKEYENTGLEPEEVSRLKTDVQEIRRSVDSLWEKQGFIKFLEARGIDVSAGVDWMCKVFDLLHDEKNKEILSIDRLRELMEADREGRCVVLPCQPSDITVYQLRDKKHALGRGVHARHVYCTEVRADGHYSLQHQGDKPCSDREFGKTWFLSKEEAEEVLKGE